MTLRKFLTTAARWAAPTVVLAQVCLVWTGVFSLGEAVAVGLALELLLAGIVITEITLARRAFKTSRSQGADGQEALNQALSAVLPAPVAKAMGMEFGLFRALWRWIRRKPDAPEGHVILAYGSEIKPIMWVMVFLVPLEILAVEFLIPWSVVRIILLVLSVYGTVWVLGFLAALSIRPHTVGDGKVVLRFAHFTQIVIPLELVQSVRTTRHSGYRRARPDRRRCTGDADRRLHHPQRQATRALPLGAQAREADARSMRSPLRRGRHSRSRPRPHSEHRRGLTSAALPSG